jgi:hypothetical protein
MAALGLFRQMNCQGVSFGVNSFGFNEASIA